MEQALAGMKVIDVSQVLAGPYCTMVLADMGAEVIKIEKYPNGDDVRAMGPFTKEESHLFMMVNRNKRGMCINLKEKSGLQIFKELIKDADVFVENYRPGVTKKLGIDYETLKQLNPALIYCSISGYGQTGPYSQKGGFDIMAQGLSGLMEMTGEASGKPVKVGIAIHDIAAAQTAIQSILTAYIHRLKKGSGQYIDVSLVDAGLAWTVWEAAAYFGEGIIPERTGTAHRASAPYQGFKTKDGNILIGAANQSLWEKFCVHVIQQPELLNNSHFASPSLRIQHLKELESEIEDILIEHPSHYWLQQLEKVGIPSGPIYAYDQTMQDPHIHAREMILEYDHPKLGSMKTLGFPAKLSATPGQLQKSAPLLGEDNRRILKGLGYTDASIEKLLTKEVIK